MLRKFVTCSSLAAMALAGGISAASAATSYVTADVNLRQGPGTSHSSVDVVTNNSQVELHGCLEDRSWCKVTSRGKTGWLSGNYLAYEVEGQRVQLHRSPRTLKSRC